MSHRQAHPTVIFIPCRNSHPFEERRFSIPIMHNEEDMIKIGRSVVRVQSSDNNAIFDCKVLSRNHALFWRAENGRFYIKDTKSSNGTFVNNERISDSGRESAPKEVFSGDILQFGVEIIETTKNIASACVICIIRLLDESGNEYPGRNRGEQLSLSFQNSKFAPGKYTFIKDDKIFMMEQYVKEAVFRENLLGQKLQLLEGHLAVAYETLQGSWQSLITEEQLLSRIEMLESQLAIFARKSHPKNEEKFRQLILELQEDRAKVETTAKDSLRKLNEQLCETTMRLHDAENSLLKQEGENMILTEKCRDFENVLQKQQNELEMATQQYNQLLIKSENIINSNNADTVESNLHDTSDKNLINNIAPAGPSTVEQHQNDSIVSEDILLQHLKQVLSNFGPNPLLVDKIIMILNQFGECGHNCDRGPFPNELTGSMLLIPTKQSTGLGISEGPSTDEYPLKSNSTDFQIFLFSTFPFILILLMVLNPFLNKWIFPVEDLKTPDGSAVSFDLEDEEKTQQ